MRGILNKSNNLIINVEDPVGPGGAPPGTDYHVQQKDK